MVKSPSDMTIYAPALERRNANRLVLNDRPEISPNLSTANKESMNKSFSEHDHLASNIDVFVGNIHEEQQRRASTAGEDEQGPTATVSTVVVPSLQEVKNHAERAILQVEKFKAKVAVPPGMICEEKQGNSDDDFFHLICHIEPGLRTKIENGEYVDLDKLLSKDQSTAATVGAADFGERLEWIRNDSGTFLVPAKRQNRISNFRRWEQAFRIYATIYCGANPHRAKEIWQYITVINTAANSYIWENVYGYDIVFRQLMQFNPNRSWAITYNHMWNLLMRDPIPGKSAHNRNGNYSNNFQSTAKGAGFGNPKKNDYCWNFNKGVKCRFGKNCKFIERCSYCNSSNHSVVSCPKLDKKEHSKGKRNEKENK